MDNKYVFQKVNINSMNFINDKNDIKFEFIDAIHNSNKYCGELICMGIVSLKMETDLDDDDPYFPQFICDVSIEKCPEKNEHRLVVFEGGSYCISLVCKEALYQK